jgi:hypothetical protein
MQTDMKKLTVAIRNFANAPKNTQSDSAPKKCLHFRDELEELLFSPRHTDKVKKMTGTPVIDTAICNRHNAKMMRSGTAAQKCRVKAVNTAARNTG